MICNGISDRRGVAGEREREKMNPGAALDGAELFPATCSDQDWL
jgi:hypothetical protein